MGNSLALTLPEIILSAGSIVLLMVAAFAGDKAARLSTWLAVLLFAVAAAFVPGIVDQGGVAFDGLFIADSFAAFAKILVYGGAAVALLAAASWFRRDRDFRAEYPCLVILSAIRL